jgi:hypothetical protein
MFDKSASQALFKCPKAIQWFGQIADFQRVLGDEKARASKLETTLELMETLR